MNGYKFYADYGSKEAKRAARKTKASAPNVIARFGETFISGSEVVVECLAALFNSPDSPVCSSSASLVYLWDACKRISEAEARRIHPAMFARLDDHDAVLYGVSVYGYTVEIMRNGRTVGDKTYTAGNASGDSTLVVSRDKVSCVPFQTLRSYARQTALEIAEGNGIDAASVHEDRSIAPDYDEESF